MPGFLRLVGLLVLVAVLAACGRGTRLDRTELLPVDEMYAEAHQAMQRGNHERAIRYYQRLIARFPFGLYTEQAQLDMAFAQHRSRKTDEAISTLDRFLKTYPTHPKADYAQYLRGIVNFQREASFLGRFVSLDPAQRDLTPSRTAFADFAKLIRDHPGSRYVPDARQRMVFLRNSMARHEIMVGQYYLRRGAFVAAVNRGKHVLESYPEAPETGDALALMTEAYVQMGEEVLAGDTRRVLELNHPEHPYLQGEEITRRKPLWRRMIPFG